MKCIYCLVDKPSSSYTKAEHIIPQSFGTFKNNFTLNDAVCDECNQFLGDNLEIYLARDTFEGTARYELGIKEAKGFKSLGKRSKLIMKVNEGPFNGAYAYREFSSAEGKILIKPIPQIGFKKNADESYQYFLLDEVPNVDILKQKGFDLKQKGSIMVLACDLEMANQVLAKNGIMSFDVEGVKAQTEPGGTTLCKLEGVIDDVVMRANAKIAFNYLAYWEGKDFALCSSFDIIRNYIRLGIKPDYPLVHPVDDSILGDEPEIGMRRMGHIVTIDYDCDFNFIYAQVSLLNWMNYRVLLASDCMGVKDNLGRGHFFNPGDQRICKLSHNPQGHNPDSRS